MNIFTKRNALVGYLTLKAHSRARRHYLRRQKRRSGLKLLTVLVLGILSMGLLIALAGVLRRRSREGEALEGADVADEAEIVPDDHGEATESIPTT